MADNELTLVDRHESVAVLSLNRPESLNAWSGELRDATVARLRELEADESVRAVVLTGAGRAFCAGADLKRPETHSVQSVDEYLDDNQGNPIFDTLGSYAKPIIAAVNGYAIGVGCLMTAACDFVLASESAIFAVPQPSLGILPAYGGTLRLARMVGRGNALNMALTGRHVHAHEAQCMGLVVDVLPPEDLLQTAVETMQAIAAMPMHAVRLTRESLRLGLDAGLPATEQADLYRQMALYQTGGSADQHREWRER